MKNWIKWKFDNSEPNSKEEIIVKRKFKVLVLLFILTIFALTNLKIIEVLSLADGKIIPQGRIKYVQHLEGGIVEEILVKEGQNVEISQPLVILSKKKASSEFEEIKTRLNSIDLSILRVESEKNLLILFKFLTPLRKILIKNYLNLRMNY